MAWDSVTELRHCLRTGEPAIHPPRTWRAVCLPRSPPRRGRGVQRHDDRQITRRRRRSGRHARPLRPQESSSTSAAVEDTCSTPGSRPHPRRPAYCSTFPAVTAQAIPRHDGRIKLHPGDFFVDPIPAYDTAVLMTVIHDWPNPEANGHPAQRSRRRSPKQSGPHRRHRDRRRRTHHVRHRRRHRHARHHRRRRTNPRRVRRPPPSGRVRRHLNDTAPIGPSRHRSPTRLTRQHLGTDRRLLRDRPDRSDDLRMAGHQHHRQRPQPVLRLQLELKPRWKDLHAGWRRFADSALPHDEGAAGIRAIGLRVHTVVRGSSGRQTQSGAEGLSHAAYADAMRGDARTSVPTTSGESAARPVIERRR